MKIYGGGQEPRGAGRDPSSGCGSCPGRIRGRESCSGRIRARKDPLQTVLSQLRGRARRARCRRRLGVCWRAQVSAWCERGCGACRRVRGSSRGGLFFRPHEQPRELHAAGRPRWSLRGPCIVRGGDRAGPGCIRPTHSCVPGVGDPRGHVLWWDVHRAVHYE